MAKKSPENLIVGLDIGTSKVLVIVAEFNENREMKIIGVGHHPAHGMRKGVVSDIESTVVSIQRAVEEAGLMAGCDINSVYAGIAGAHIHSINSHGVVAIRDGEVTEDDVERVIEAAQAMAVPNGQRILHVLPQDFSIDEQHGIRDPVGMSGVRMEARVHIITSSISAAQNIIKCIRRCGLEVNDLVLEQIASSRSVLTDDERDLGVCMIDIGGGTTDIAIFHEGSIRHTTVIPIAGDQVSNDIAMAFNTPRPAAEDIKKRFGAALVKLVDQHQTIQTPSIGGRPPRSLLRRHLAEVIEPRIEELMVLIQAEIRREGVEKMISSGIVLTGGTSRLEGIIDLAEEIFHLPVRQGVPNYQGGLSHTIQNPIYSTGFGLVKFGYSNDRLNKVSNIHLTSTNTVLFSIKKWIKSGL